ncbi:hypothetical protein C8R45DRAFT_1165792 [Mycena sanguinolenta]|nr:hypothetical protein C8R45DRAFT_1165792 [Mycena sanguinolenta]
MYVSHLHFRQSPCTTTRSEHSRCSRAGQSAPSVIAPTLRLLALHPALTTRPARVSVRTISHAEGERAVIWSRLFLHRVLSRSSHLRIVSRRTPLTSVRNGSPSLYSALIRSRTAHAERAAQTRIRATVVGRRARVVTKAQGRAASGAACCWERGMPADGERNERQQPWGGGKGAQKRRTAASSDATPQTTRRRNKEKGRDERKQGRNEGKWRGNSHADSSSSSPSIPASRGWYCVQNERALMGYKGGAARPHQEKRKRAPHCPSGTSKAKAREGCKEREGRERECRTRTRSFDSGLRSQRGFGPPRRHIEPNASSAAADVPRAHGRRGWAAESDGERLCEGVDGGQRFPGERDPEPGERFCSVIRGLLLDDDRYGLLGADAHAPGKQPTDGANNEEDGEQRQRQAERREALGEGEGGRGGVKGVPMDWEDDHRASAAKRRRGCGALRYISGTAKYRAPTRTVCGQSDSEVEKREEWSGGGTHRFRLSNAAALALVLPDFFPEQWGPVRRRASIDSKEMITSRAGNRRPLRAAAGRVEREKLFVAFSRHCTMPDCVSASVEERRGMYAGAKDE